MKKLLGIISIFVLSLFVSSAFAGESSMKDMVEEQPQATLEESQSALDRFAVWPFESIEQKSQDETAGTIDSVKVDQSADADDKIHSVTGIDDPIVESD